MDTHTETPLGRRWVVVLGGVAALMLAGAGEALVELRTERSVAALSPHLSLALYVLGFALFTVSAWSLPASAAELPVEGPSPKPGHWPGRRMRWIVLSAGLALSIGLAAWSGALIRKDLRTVQGAWLWVGSLVVLLAVALVLHSSFGWTARWGECSWPKTRRAGWLTSAAVLAILVVAALARFLWLDTIPLGLNADEGDRAGLSIQILRGQVSRGLFDYGWYRIHMIYFNLLAVWMKLVGMGYVQARWFDGIAGVVGVGVLTWLGLRNFGLRIGLMAGALMSLLAVSLQFGRITTEAGPTAMLWTISLALFLEAARRGRLSAWIGAGLAGGVSIYFYPSGRLWAVFALGFCAYLLVHGLGGRRLAIFGGSAIAAVAAIVASTPFLVLAYQAPEVLTLRAQETSIFTQNNVARLAYYKPGMSLASLMVEQLAHAVGIFNQYGDRGGVWPTEHAILTSGALAALTLVGLGWISLRWRDPRSVALAVFFWVGLSGIIVTVETPNMHRMATAIPILGIFPALVLDNLARRVEWVAAVRATLPRLTPPPMRWATTSAVVLAAGALVVSEAHYYFVEYAAMDKWWYATRQGQAVHAQGSDTLVMGIGRYFHFINSGWVRLLAFDVPRGELRVPGSDLPLPIRPERNQAFMVFPKQSSYLPYLRELYPSGTLTENVHPTEGLQFWTFRVPREQLAAMQGATVWPASGGPIRVDALGVAPPSWSSYPASMRWTAGIRVPRYWNYVFQIGPGPARLTVDGYEVLSIPPGGGAQVGIAALARGDHAISYEGTLVAAGEPALFRWAEQPEAQPGGLAVTPTWRTPKREDLFADMSEPRGLLGVVKVGERPEQHRVDRALVACCLNGQLRGDQPYSATWRGTVTAPADGTYQMLLLAPGTSDLKIDGQTVIHSDKAFDEPVQGQLSLTAGPHQVEVSFRYVDGPSDLEWAWTPPGGQTSIVPPSALSPPPNSTAGPPVRPETFGRRELQPAVEPVFFEP